MLVGAGKGGIGTGAPAAVTGDGFGYAAGDGVGDIVLCGEPAGDGQGGGSSQPSGRSNAPAGSGRPAPHCQTGRSHLAVLNPPPTLNLAGNALWQVSSALSDSLRTGLSVRDGRCAGRPTPAPRASPLPTSARQTSPAHRLLPPARPPRDESQSRNPEPSLRSARS